MEALWRSQGIAPPTKEELADLPPWSDEDAAAFKRSIDEATGRIDEAQRARELSALSEELASLRLQMHALRTGMDATFSSSETSPAKPPVTSTAASVMEAFWRSMGMVPPTKDEMENVPPWTEEEATAFERRINEAFEQIEDDDHRL